MNSSTNNSNTGDSRWLAAAESGATSLSTTAFHKARRHHDALTQHMRAAGNLIQQRETLMGVCTSIRKEGTLVGPASWHPANTTPSSQPPSAVSAEITMKGGGCTTDDDEVTVSSRFHIPLRSSRSSALGVLGFFAAASDETASCVSSSSSSSADNLFVVTGLIGSLTRDVDALLGECHQLTNKFEEEVAKFGYEIETVAAAHLTACIRGGKQSDDGDRGGLGGGGGDTREDADNERMPPSPPLKVIIELIPDVGGQQSTEGALMAATSAYRCLLSRGAMLRRMVLYSLRRDMQLRTGVDAMAMYDDGSSQQVDGGKGGGSDEQEEEERFLIGDVVKIARRMYASLLQDCTNNSSCSNESGIKALLDSYGAKYTRLCGAVPSNMGNRRQPPPAAQMSDIFLDVADALEMGWVCEGVLNGYLRPTIVSSV